MKLSLEQLKNNTKPTKFKFLSPLKDYIDKEYKGVLKNANLTKNHVYDIIEKIRKESILACYDSPETILTVASIGNAVFDKDKKEWVVRLRTVKPESYLDNSYSNYWGSNVEYLLSELYIVSSKEALEEHVLETLIKEEEKQKVAAAKRAEAQRKDLIRDSKWVEKYGLKNKLNHIQRYIIEFIESKGDVEKFKALSRLTNNIEDNCCCNCCC